MKDTHWKMKLKQRITFALIFGIAIILFFIQGVFIISANEEYTNKDWSAGLPGVKRDLHDLKSSGENSILPKSSRFFGHLNFPRKDLDASNNTSAYEKNGKSEPLDSGANSSVVHLMEDGEAPGYLQERILKEGFFKTKDNIDKLMVAIDFIKKTSESGGLSVEHLKNVLAPQNYENQRFVFQNGKSMDDSMKRIKLMEKSVELHGEELATLRNVRPHSYLLGGIKRKGRVLNMYDESNPNITSWQKFHSHISQFELYRGDDPALDAVIDDLQHQEIVDSLMRGGGTQLKLIFYFDNGARVLFKPMRFPRSQETLPNHFYFSDYERHNAEIAAFHLDRALGFHRSPPVAGRMINITQHIKPYADHDLLKTFFVSPAGNICFHGVCDYYCDTGHAICGNPELLEGSFAQYLPSSKRVDRKTWRHPWKRSYHKRKKAPWEEDNNFCSKVRTTAPYNEGRRLLDLMDMAVFDFLMGNLDRHHYETLVDFGNYTTPIHLDNGRGFGKAFHDEISILAPIYQCCLMRYSTLQKMLKFDQGSIKLSDIMRKYSSSDLLSPVLLEQHLLALDRRVKIILKTVYKCIEKNGSAQKVVVDDGF